MLKMLSKTIFYNMFIQDFVKINMKMDLLIIILFKYKNNI